jgi:hypothetical protein
MWVRYFIPGFPGQTYVFFLDLLVNQGHLWLRFSETVTETTTYKLQRFINESTDWILHP